MRDLKPDEIKAVLELAYEFGFKGFGGRCAAAAMAINRVLFQGKGSLVIAVNEALWSKGRFVGHVVVEYGGVYWDADAKPKSQSDIDDWGDVSGDAYYKLVAKEFGIRWTKKRASTTALFILDSESELSFGHDEVDEFSGTLKLALQAFRQTHPNSLI